MVPSGGNAPWFKTRSDFEIVGDFRISFKSFGNGIPSLENRSIQKTLEAKAWHNRAALALMNGESVIMDLLF